MKIPKRERSIESSIMFKEKVSQTMIYTGRWKGAWGQLLQWMWTTDRGPPSKEELHAKDHHKSCMHREQYIWKRGIPARWYSSIYSYMSYQVTRNNNRAAISIHSKEKEVKPPINTCRQSISRHQIFYVYEKSTIQRQYIEVKTNVLATDIHFMQPVVWWAYIIIMWRMIL